jgi:RNA polymerase subunit RPABC4/transcription elongation factor Spt4
MRWMRSITPFVECPNCRKLLDVKTTQCPECRELISREYAALSAFTLVVNTKACNLAKEIASRDRMMAALFVAASIVLYFMDFRTFGSLFFFWFTIVTPVAQLLMVVAWYVLYGRFPLGDSDFVRAKRRIMWSGRLWGLILALDIAVLLASRHGSRP